MDSKPPAQERMPSIRADGVSSTTWTKQIEPASAVPERAGSSRSRILYWAAALLVVAGGASFLILRGFSKTSPETPVVPAATPVSVATVKRETVFDTVRIDAEFRPYVEAELRAKVAGYLTNIPVDFGDKVKSGQLLAEIDVPELQNELARAKAAREQAVADHYKAHLEYQRLLEVQKEHPNLTLVPQQDLDNADAKDRATQAAIDAAKAEVEKYQTLFSYTKIYAPFDGVITKRYADPGTLIQTGTGTDTQSLPLVRISDNYLLRLDFPVSVPYVKDIKAGEPVEVEVESLNHKRFSGKITRFEDRVDKDTRKMWTEIEVPNPNLEMVPGMYATVSLKVDPHTNALTIPIEAVSNEGKPSVYLVDANNQIQAQRVTLGVETPDKWEVLDGLKEGDRVIIGNRSEMKPGEKVQPVPWTEPPPNSWSTPSAK